MFQQTNARGFSFYVNGDRLSSDRVVRMKAKDHLLEDNPHFNVIVCFLCDIFMEVIRCVRLFICVCCVTIAIQAKTIDAVGELYIIFLRNYRDKQVRTNEALSDGDLCQVFLDTLDYMQNNHAPAQLKDVFRKELVKAYKVNTFAELQATLTQNAQAQQPLPQAQDQGNENSGADSQDENMSG